MRVAEYTLPESLPAGRLACAAFPQIAIEPRRAAPRLDRREIRMEQWLFRLYASVRNGGFQPYVLTAASEGTIFAAPVGAKARMPDGGSGPPGGGRITQPPRSGRERRTG